MLAEAVEAVEAAGLERACEVDAELIWRIEPIPFDPDLVAAARRACQEVTGVERGPDKRRPPRRRRGGAGAARGDGLLPVDRRVSATPPEEDTAEEGLTAGIEAFGLLANRVLSG